MKNMMFLVAPLAVCLLMTPQAEAKKFEQEICVTNTNDSGPGSLRDAVDQANKSEKSTHIVFKLKKCDPGYDRCTKKWTIKSESSIDITARKVKVDGYSQKGSKPNTNAPGEPSNACVKVVVQTPPCGAAMVAKAVASSIARTAKKLLGADAANDAIIVPIEGEITVTGVIGLRP